jgi:replicative DNA helicase
MSDIKLIFRMASSLCGISSKRLDSLHPLQRDQFQSQLNELKRLDTMRIYQRKMDARAIENTIRHLHKKRGVEVVFIDYAQLIEPYDNKTNREQQVARISRTLKRLTRELNIMIVALAQISKESEKENRKPRASDLRESQSLRHDADRCYFIYKPIQNRSGQPQDTESTIYDVLYYVDKNRDDQTGQSVWLRFDTPAQRLREIDERGGF